MKTNCKLLMLIFGLASFQSMAQKEDSVQIIYDNQKTIIPVPAMGSRTSVNYADSLEVVQIDVARVKPGDISHLSYYSSNNLTPDKPLKKVKWYSQIEAGYNLKFSPYHESYVFYYIGTQQFRVYYNTNNSHGYNLGITILEKERSITDRFSYISGFKLAFAQSFRKGKDPYPRSTNPSDTIILNSYVDYEATTNYSLQFLFPFGFRRYFGPEKLNARINFGTNIGSSQGITKSSLYNRTITHFSPSSLFLQPYFGFEKGKFGILTSGEVLFGSRFKIAERSTVLNVQFGIGASLTYRFF